jgi:hypothetical protein
MGMISASCEMISKIVHRIKKGGFTSRKFITKSHHCSDAYDWGCDDVQEFEFPVPFVSFEHGGVVLEPVLSWRHGASASKDAARCVIH